MHSKTSIESLRTHDRNACNANVQHDGRGEVDIARAVLDPTLPVDSRLLRMNLYLFIWLKAIGSYDSGAFSAALGAANGIAEEWRLTAIQQGTLTSSVFLGNVIGCPIAGHLLYRYSEKSVLGWSLFLHAIFTAIFATFGTYYAALVSRFFIGITLAFIVVYTPVWVDEFAPKERQSVWMASHNAGVPLGIMLGYVLGAFFPSYTTISWEWAFYIKCVLMVPTVLYLLKVDRRSIDAHCHAEVAERRARQDARASLATNSYPLEPRSAVQSFSTVIRQMLLSLWVGCRPLLSNVTYMCSIFSMTSLYFVATGLQNFVTPYLREPPFNASMKVIMTGFGAAVVTAPVCGVIVGGILLDRIGGYQGNLLRVAQFACVWGASAAVFSVVCVFITSTGMFLLVMSIVLFCGGALVPSGVGLSMSTLPDHLRPVGAAVSQTLYNLLGNFGGPLVCGAVAEWTRQLKYGIMTLLLSSGVGMIPLLLLLLIAWRGRHYVTEVSDTTSTQIVVHFDDDVELSQRPSHSPFAKVLTLTPPSSTSLDVVEHPKPFSGVSALGAGSPSVGVPVASAGERRRTHQDNHVAVISRGDPPKEGFQPSLRAEDVARESNKTPHRNSLPRGQSKCMGALTTFSESVHSCPTVVGGENASAINSTYSASLRDGSAISRRQSLDLDMVELENVAAQAMSLPSPHRFGMDLVRSWIISQTTPSNQGVSDRLQYGIGSAEREEVHPFSASWRQDEKDVQ